MNENPETPSEPEEKPPHPDLPPTELLSTLDAASGPREAPPLPLPDLPERVGQYTVERIIGRGAMGVVYQARQDGLDRTVALKLLLEGAHASKSLRSRFLREARAMAKLRHPNIVSVLEVGEFQGHPFFAMDHVNGLPLNEFARKFQVTSPAVIADLCARIAEAIQVAHENGIVHRDLKPGNILIDGHGEPVITDFGLSKDLTSASVHSVGGEIMGTPTFMSPEQADGKPDLTDERSDVYALGAVLYFLLTRQEPFRGANLVEILSAVIHDEPRPIIGIAPDTPGDLEAICMMAMEKNRDDRYPSARALAQDLRKFLDGEPVSASPWGRRRQTVRFFRRRKQAVGGIVLGALLMLAGALVSQRYFSRSYLDLARGYAASEDATLRADMVRGLGREIAKPNQLKPERIREAMRVMHDRQNDVSPDVQTALLEFYAAFGDLPGLKESMGASHFDWLIAKAGQPTRPDQRDLALQAIGKIRRPQFALYLVSRLREPNPSLRKKVVRALGHQKSRKSLYPLLTMIAQDPDCRTEAKAALQKFYEEGRISIIRKQNHEVMSALEAFSQDLAVYNNTLESALSSAIPGMRTEDPLDAFREQLASKDPITRLEALHQIGMTGSSAAEQVFLEALVDEDERVGFMAALHVSRSLSAETQKHLEQLLVQTDDVPARRRAARTLGMSRSPGAVAPLLRVLGEEPDPEVLEAVVVALGEAGDSSVIPELQRIAEKHPSLEKSIREAVEGLQSGEKAVKRP